LTLLRAVWEILTQYMEAEGGRLVTLELERRKADLLVVATVHATQPLSQETVEDLEALLSGHLDHLVQLDGKGRLRIWKRKKGN
jgi:hypothetical protein